MWLVNAVRCPVASHCITAIVWQDSTILTLSWNWKTDNHSLQWRCITGWQLIVIIGIIVSWLTSNTWSWQDLCVMCLVGRDTQETEHLNTLVLVTYDIFLKVFSGLLLAPWTYLQCSTVWSKIITLRILHSTVINSNTLAGQMVLTAQVN